MAGIHKRPRSQYYQASFRDKQGRQIIRSTKVTDRDKAMAIALEWERLANGTDELVETPANTVAADSKEREGGDFIAPATPELKVDPPTLVHPERDESGSSTEKVPSTTKKTKTVEVKVSALAILCMVSALLGFLFFPALAALPLGILALRRIDESRGTLTGRHLAVTGLCITVVTLTAWLALISAGWIALELLEGFARIIFPGTTA